MPGSEIITKKMKYMSIGSNRYTKKLTGTKKTEYICLVIKVNKNRTDKNDKN